MAKDSDEIRQWIVIKVPRQYYETTILHLATPSNLYFTTKRGRPLSFRTSPARPVGAGRTEQERSFHKLFSQPGIQGFKNSVLFAQGTLQSQFLIRHAETIVSFSHAWTQSCRLLKCVCSIAIATHSKIRKS